MFPDGIRNIWLTRDFSALLDKIKRRNEIHKQLEAAESDLIRECKRRQLKQREKDEKAERKQLQTNKPTKKERLQRQKDEDREARRRAVGDGGISMGDQAQETTEAPDTDTVHPHPHDHSRSSSGQLNPFNAVGKVFKTGATAVERAGQGVKGGISAVGQGLDEQLERSGGFMPVKGVAAQARPSTAASDRRNLVNKVLAEVDDDGHKTSFGTEWSQGLSDSNGSKNSDQQDLNPGHQHLNTVRKLEHIEDIYVKESTKWYQFWKPPSGSYASPVPQGVETDPFDDEIPLLAKIKRFIPFMGDDEAPVAYPPYVNPGQNEVYEERPGPEWEKWVKAKDRPHHRLPLFDFTPGWLPAIPGIHKKVDTIYWCRQELARLNSEIEEDQNNPTRFPVMTSAFIQFNNQAAAHMACQCAIHHVPKQMAPRVVEVSPDDVIWDNMAMVSICVRTLCAFSEAVAVRCARGLMITDLFRRAGGCSGFVSSWPAHSFSAWSSSGVSP